MSASQVHSAANDINHQNAQTPPTQNQVQHVRSTLNEQGTMSSVGRFASVWW